MTAEAKLEVLRKRARALAQPLETDKALEDHLDVLVFLLAYETYCVESAYVREVYPLKDLTPVPCTPPFVLGIINVRGRLLSIIDLKKFFDLPEKGLTDLNKVIILDNGTMEFGILADAMLGYRHIPFDTIQTSLASLSGIYSDYLKGVTKERTIILDAEKILSDKNIVVHDETKR